jgi:nucleoside 2-deoxyribosyltransferase
MKVYFAHPAFTDDQKTFKQAFLKAFTGALKKRRPAGKTALPEVVDPFDHAPDIENSGADKAALAGAVASICCRLLDDCDLAVALTDDNDAGVAFELGYAYAHSIPAILVSRTGAAEGANAMLTGTAQAFIGNVMDGDRMRTLVDLVYGFAAAGCR